MTAPAAAPPDSKPGQGLKVLVIDDNRSHAEVMAETHRRMDELLEKEYGVESPGLKKTG